MKLSIEDQQLLDELCRQNNVSREKAGGNALVSFELGVSYATVNRWENGQARPSKLARAQLDAFCERMQAAGVLDLSENGRG